MARPQGNSEKPMLGRLAERDKARTRDRSWGPHYGDLKAGIDFHHAHGWDGAIREEEDPRGGRAGCDRTGAFLFPADMVREAVKETAPKEDRMIHYCVCVCLGTAG